MTDEEYRADFRTSRMRLQRDLLESAYIGPNSCATLYSRSNGQGLFHAIRFIDTHRERMHMWLNSIDAVAVMTSAHVFVSDEDSVQKYGLTARLGDWILRNEIGLINVIDHDSFLNDYKLITE